MRLAVYTDYAYHRLGGEVRAERAFAIFLAGLANEFDRLVLIGRLSPDGARARYPVGARAELVPLPFYASLARPWRALPAFARSLIAFWRGLDEVDCVWLLGPHPLAICFALLATARRRRVVLGVRQDLPAYVRNRHPGRFGLLAAALALEGAYRVLARFFPVVVVGPDLARRYRSSRALLELTVSLIEEDDLVSPDEAAARRYDGELRVLSVGRLDPEKNPLLLAEVLARLATDGHDWRLVVCGEGSMQEKLEARLVQLGLEERVDLLGYVPFGEPLLAVYRSSHMLLHVSLTEGLPQVLLEAFAAGLPVVATDVGGIAGAVGKAARMVPPGSAEAAARQLAGLAADPRGRRALVEAGHAIACARTATAERRRLAEFLHRTRA